MDSLRPRNFSDYTRAARRHKLLILFTVAAVTVASTLAINHLPDLYESSAVVAVEVAQAESNSTVDTSRLLATLQQQVTAPARLEALITRYKLYREQIEKGARIDDFVAEMRGRIGVAMDSSREPAANAFIIWYRAADPETAQKVTADLTGELTGDNPGTADPHAGGEAELLRQRVAYLSGRLSDLEQKHSSISAAKTDAAPAAAIRQSSYQPSSEAARAQQLTIENLKDQKYKLEQQLADLDRRIAGQQQVVEQQKKSVALRDNPTIAALIAKRAELQGLRDNLVNRQELTDKHPRVAAITDQIAAVNRQIAELRQQDSGAPSQSPEARELVALQSDRNRLKLELEITNRAIERQLANPPMSAAATAPRTVVAVRPDAAAAQSSREYLEVKQAYQEAAARLRDLELKQPPTSSAKTERFRVLTGATLPARPAWPNRALLSLSALLVGLALGAFGTLLIEMRRFATLQDARDVQYYARLPLLAAIPKTSTAIERRQIKRREAVKLALGTAVAIAATCALTKILIITNLLSFIGS